MNWYFPHIICVNLARREDKWADCIKEFKKHNIKVERFDAVDGNPIGYEGSLPDGAIGNALSQIEIIKEAKQKEYDRILILEDDIEFHDDFNNLFNEWVKEVPEDWDLLYLGGNHNFQDKVMVSPHVRSINDTYATHAYAIRHTVYDLVLEHMSDFSIENDVALAEVQKKCKAYCFSPNIAYQRPSISDVFNRWVDYDFFKKADDDA
jgi:GR25 family glycosyltransferase involved in LPS biosynthesis